MFLLDTNVLSALMYPAPPIAVVEWVSARSYDEPFYGQRLPSGGIGRFGGYAARSPAPGVGAGSGNAVR